MLELFVKENCPFCKKVEKFFNEHNVEYEGKKLSDPKNMDELMKIGGKDQAPFLIDKENHNFLYESDDIIEYVKFNVLMNPDL